MAQDPAIIYPAAGPESQNADVIYPEAEPDAGGGGGGLRTWAVKTINYSVLSDDQDLGGDATGGAVAFTLPAPGGVEDQEFLVMKVDTSLNFVTVAGTFLFGGTRTLLFQGNALRVKSIGTSYIVMWTT